MYKKDKNSINLRMNELKTDLDRVNADLHKALIAQENDLSPSFLKGFAEDILRLNRHAEELEELSNQSDSPHLIHYLLDTPWGAPFVSESTLLRAATIYPDEEHEISELKRLIDQFREYEHKSSIPFLTLLESLGHF